jgi:hypothetical protein
MVEDGDQIPTATPPERITPTEGSIEVARFLIRGDVPSRAIRLDISLDESLVAKIDRAAEASATTRSGFLAQAARKVLAERD